MMLVKLSREHHHPTEDNLVDIIGYAAAKDQLREEEKAGDSLDPDDLPADLEKLLPHLAGLRGATLLLG